MGVLRVVVWVLVVLLVLIGGGAVAISVRHHRAEPGLHESATLDDDDAAWLAALPDIDVETRALAWAWMTAD